MEQYINVHSALNALREKALKTKTVGPTALVTGLQSSGKSTLCKILINYSLKLGWTPIYCDLDLNQNDIAPPGNIAAALVEESLPNDDLIQSALCYFHGSTSPITLEFFDRQVEELAKNVKAKL